MKFKYLLESVICATIIACATLPFVGSSSAQSQQYRPDVSVIYNTDGNPNTNGKYGNPGDICVDKTTGSLFVKTGPSGTTSWQANPAITSATNNPVTGSLVLTSTSVKFYLTPTTGIEIKSGTTAPF
jgi:hypothetical protein